MTVETQENRIVYPADGVTEDFAFNFKTDDVETIKVYVDAIITLAAVVVTLNPDQELTPGGNVNITPAPTAPDIVTITREEDFLQLTKYPVGGDFPSASHETALDKTIKLTQQIDDKFVRSIRADINEPLAGVSLVIPNATDRKSTFLGFDSLGNAIVSPGGPGTVPVSLFMTPVLSAIDGDAAKTLLEIPYKSAAVYSTITQSIPDDGNYTVVTFNGEDYDDYDLFNAGTDNTAIIIPDEAKRIRLRGYARFSPNTTGVRQMYVNAGPSLLRGSFRTMNATSEDPTMMAVDVDVNVSGFTSPQKAAGATFLVRQTSGGNLDIGDASNQEVQSYFSLEVIA